MGLGARGGCGCERWEVEGVHARERTLGVRGGRVGVIRTERRLLVEVVLIVVECSSVVCEVECFDRYIGRLTAPLRDPLTYGLIRVAVIGLDVRGRW